MKNPSLIHTELRKFVFFQTTYELIKKLDLTQNKAFTFEKSNIVKESYLRCDALKHEIKISQEDKHVV